MASNLVVQVLTRVVDKETGEVFGTEQVIHEGPVSTEKLERERAFVLAYQKKLAEVVLDKDFKGNDLRVYMTLLSMLDWHNWLAVSQKEVAGRLDIAAPDVSKSMKMLREKGILIRSKKGVYPVKYQLSADYAYKGTEAMAKITQAKQRQRGGSNVYDFPGEKAGSGCRQQSLPL